MMKAKKIVCILLCVVLAAAIGTGADGAAAKTSSSDAAENVFFYAVDNSGREVFLTTMNIEKELLPDEHGYQSGAMAGKDYACLTIDHLPTVNYCEGRGYTPQQLLRKAIDKTLDQGQVPGVGELGFDEDDDRIAMMTTDAQVFKSDNENYSRAELVNVKRYFFPGLYDAFKAQGRDYITCPDLNTRDADYTTDPDNADYSKYFNAQKNAIFAGGVETPVYFATSSYSGRVSNLIGEGLLPYGVTGNGLFQSLGSVLDQKMVLRIVIPQTEEEMRTGFPTTNNVRKWIFAIRLREAGESPITSAGTVAAPELKFRQYGDRITVSADCDTPGAQIYTSINDGGNTLTAQFPYSGPQVIRDDDGGQLRVKVHAVRPGYDDAGIQEKTFTAVVPSALETGLSAKAVSYNSVRLSWTKKDAAAGVQIYRASGKNGAYRLIKTISGNSQTTYTDKGLPTGRTAYYKVRLYRSADTYGEFSPVRSARPVLGRAGIRSLKAGKRKATLRWRKVAGAGGYQIRYARNKKMTRARRTITLKKGSKLRRTIRKLKKKRYYFKVRAFRNVSGKRVYGSYSTVRSVRVK